MDANAAWTRRTRGKIWQDHCDVADLCDNRVRLVGGALPMASRMDMDIGHNAQTCRAAISPQLAKPSAVDFDDAGREGIGINIVIEDEFSDLTPLARSAQEKSAGLSLTMGTAAQLVDAHPPNLAGTNQLRRLPEDDARER
jgi:hypothetical protein